MAAVMCIVHGPERYVGRLKALCPASASLWALEICHDKSAA